MALSFLPHFGLRRKIQHIVSRGDGQVDPDAPADDPDSIQFWVNRKASYEETSSFTQQQQLTMHGQASEQFVEHLGGGVAPSAALSRPMGPVMAASTSMDAMLAAARNAGAGQQRWVYLFLPCPAVCFSFWR